VAALRVGVGRRTRHHALLRERARQVQHTLSLTRVEGQGQPTFMGEVQSMPSSPCPHRQLYLFLCETRSSRALPGKKKVAVLAFEHKKMIRYDTKIVHVSFETRPEEHLVRNFVHLSLKMRHKKHLIRNTSLLKHLRLCGQYKL
jgi:hypothetical protein